MRNEATNKVINHNFFTQIKPSGWSSALTLLISLLFSFLSMCFCLLFDTLCQKEYVLRIMRQITVCLHRTHCASVELRIEPSWQPYVDIICFDGPMSYFLLTLLRRRLQEASHCCCQFDHKIEIGKKKTLRKRQILQISCSQSKT